MIMKRFMARSYGLLPRVQCSQFVASKPFRSARRRQRPSRATHDSTYTDGMDIVTHAAAGIVLASPFLPEHPLAASGFILGSALPDLDSLSRLAGQRVFLRVHQGWTHALPVAAAIGVAGLVLHLPLFVGVALGMALHSLLDYTNTYGTSLLWPVRKQRYCREWIFFIDVVVLVAVFAALAFVALEWQSSTAAPALAFGVFFLGYLAVRILLRRRAFRIAPAGTTSLIPSAVVPWRFLGLAGSETFVLDAIRGRISNRRAHPILDERWRDTAMKIEEFRTMAELSSGYHVVAADADPDGTRLLCRDLRTRNFATKFGDLEILIPHNGAPQVLEFHV